jgi:hypothetical protein
MSSMQHCPLDYCTQESVKNWRKIDNFVAFLPETKDLCLVHDSVRYVTDSA